jgi:hypothetical protein
MPLNLPPDINAESVPDYPGVSCLAKHEADILLLRRKRWPYRTIITWLESKGTHTSLGNLHRFYKLSLKRHSSKAVGSTVPTSNPAFEQKPRKPDLRWGIPEE